MNYFEDIADSVVTLAVIGCFLPSFFINCATLTSGKVGGFETKLEKTALETYGDSLDSEQHLTGDDIIMSMAIADDYEPQPRKFNIHDSYSITFDETFKGNRSKELTRIVNYYKSNNHEQVITKVHNDEKLIEWKVSDKNE